MLTTNLTAFTNKGVCVYNKGCLCLCFPTAKKGICVSQCLPSSMQGEVTSNTDREGEGHVLSSLPRSGLSSTYSLLTCWKGFTARISIRA